MRTGTMEKVAKPSTRPLVRPAHCNGVMAGATALPKKGPVVIASYSGYPVTILHYGAGGSVKGLSRF